MKKIRKLNLRVHAPTILSITAAFGVIGTAVTSAIASYKYKKSMDEQKCELSKKEKTLKFIYYYIPAFTIGTGTIICIFGANILNRRQIASLASAYQLLDCQFREYQNKLKELYGIEAHEKVMDAIALQHCEPPRLTAPAFLSESSLDPGKLENPEIVRTFYDSYSQRYFESTLSDVLQAEYHLNRNYELNGGIYLNDFYEMLGIDNIQAGDAVGWFMNETGVDWIDFDHRVMTLEDGLEIIVLDFIFHPIAEGQIIEEYALDDYESTV